MTFLRGAVLGALALLLLPLSAHADEVTEAVANEATATEAAATEAAATEAAVTETAAEDMEEAKKKRTCLWEGRAPACNGECRPGYTLVRRGKSGDGKKCVTGSKAKCCKTSDIIIRGTAPLCNGKCKKGEERLGDSDYGPNGKKCRTGNAAICRINVN